MPRLLIFISTYSSNRRRRDACRSSWFRYLQGSERIGTRVEVTFLGSRCRELEEEAAQLGDITLVDAPEGYDQLWSKALMFLRQLVQTRTASDAPQFVMHVDDDSFVRVDLLDPEIDRWPSNQFYYGYVWDGQGSRHTAPIRNTANKSYIPESQWPYDYYPPFASGCGFVLSFDLVLALASHDLPQYRLLDPPFGIHLCGPPGIRVLPEPVTPVHDERVRPYKPIPTFRPDTLVQHYLSPEEMKPFYAQASENASSRAQCAGPDQVDEGAPNAPHALYDQLVSMGLLRR